MRNVRYYIPGSIMIFIAILVLAAPEILIAFIASVIIMMGVGALYLGHMIKKSEMDFRDFDERAEDNSFDSRCFFRSPEFKRWDCYF